MKKLLTAAAALAILTGAAGAASAQSYGYGQSYGQGYSSGYGSYERGYDRAENRYERRQHKRHWRKGGRIERSEWNRYNRVDYRAYRLRQPPRGYEWRQTNSGEMILAAIATGLILDLLMR